MNGTEAGGVYIKNYDPITLIDNPSPALYVVAIWLTDYESFLDLGHFTTSAVSDIVRALGTRWPRSDGRRVSYVTPP